MSMGMEKFNQPERIKTVVREEKYNKMLKVAEEKNVILDVVARSGEDYVYEGYTSPVPEGSVCIEIVVIRPDIINDFWKAVNAE